MTTRTVVYVMGSLNAGGAERQVLTLVKGLDRRRWRPVVCGMRGGTLAGEFAAAAPCHILEKARAIDLKAFVRLTILLRRYHPAVLHTYMSTGNTWGRLGAVAASVARRSAAPVIVVSERGIDAWKTGLHRLVDRLLLGMTDTVVGNSRAVTAYLSEHNRVPPYLLRTISNGIDIARAQRHFRMPVAERNDRRAKFGFLPEHFVVGHVGRADPVKGLDALVEVIRRAHMADARVRLLRVTQPPLPRERATAEWFDRTVIGAGLGGVVRQHPYTSDISLALAMMDTLVQTSVSEGMPNVVMEAMAMELPVVVTAAGGTVELVRHRETGWIVPVEDREGILAGLHYVQRHPDEAAGWGRRARRLIEREYTDAVMVARTEALYEELLARRGLA